LWKEKIWNNPTNHPATHQSADQQIHQSANPQISNPATQQFRKSANQQPSKFAIPQSTIPPLPPQAQQPAYSITGFPVIIRDIRL